MNFSNTLNLKVFVTSIKYFKRTNISRKKETLFLDRNQTRSVVLPPRTTHRRDPLFTL